MSFWNIISEIILFRWLFRSEKKTDNHYTDRKSHYTKNHCNDQYDDLDNFEDIYYEKYDQHHDYDRSFDDFCDEQDDYDFFDGL